MQPSSPLLVFFLLTSASASGTIDLFQNSGCIGDGFPRQTVNAAGCDGACHSYHADAVSIGNVDNGYACEYPVFNAFDRGADLVTLLPLVTVYTDSYCTNGAMLVTYGCEAGNWNSFSYDCD